MSTTSKVKNLAELEHVLLDFDGPQVVLLRSGKRRIMAVAIKAYKDFKLPFFACSIKDLSYEKYMDGRADLKYVFDTAFYQKHYFFDFTSVTDIALNKATKDEVSNDKYWPKIGFFSRSHSSDYGKDTSEKVIKKFEIDGNWDAPDFARFNNKLADLYAICDILNKSEDKISSANLKHNISDQNFESGGSYGALYKKMKSNASSLRLKEVQYASPGHISMSGNKDALAEVSDLIETFDEGFDEIELNSKALDTLLRKEKLLSAPPDTRFESAHSEKMAVKYAEELYLSMGLENVDWVKTRCSGNNLIFAKFVRSIFNRALALWSYRREGRLQGIEFVSA